MLVELDEKFVQSLSSELERLSQSDKQYFRPHEFDVESIRSLREEKGNHYYIYLDESDEFAGYAMLPIFGRCEIPTSGCAILKERTELNAR